MNRSVAVVIAISFFAVACGKPKSGASSSTASAAATKTSALSSSDPCAMMACRRPPSSTSTSTSTATTLAPSPPVSISSSTDSGVSTAPEVAAAPAVPEAPVTPQASAPSAPTTLPVDDTTGLNDAQKMAKNASLNCVNGDCNPSVGLLSVVLKEGKAWSAGQCTASLVAPDTLATNAHCIPTDLEQPGSSCHNRLWITFATDHAHPEYDRQVGCAQVLFRRKDPSLEGADYAYLKLERASNRPALRISQTGFSNDKVYHIHKINPVTVDGALAGTFMKADCRSYFDSDLYNAPLDAQSPSMLFTDLSAQNPCKVIPGNSGSPIFADDGSVRGLIYAYVKKPEIIAIYSKNGSILPALDQLANLNVGTNFACLNLPGEGFDAQPAACAGQQERILARVEAVNAARVKAMLPAAQGEIAKNEKGHPDVLAFGWTLSLTQTEETGIIGTGVPSCVHVAAASSMLGKEAAISRPVFDVMATYDKFLHASRYQALWGGFEPNPESMTLSQEGDAFPIEIDDADTGAKQLSGTLGACLAQK